MEQLGALTTHTAYSSTSRSSLARARTAEGSSTRTPLAFASYAVFYISTSALHDFLTSRIATLLGLGPTSSSPSTLSPSPKLTFLMGTDTVARLFALRYYASEAAMPTALHRSLSPNGDDSWIVCARRVSQGVPRVG